MPLSLDGTTGISASGNITGGNVIASGSLVVGSFTPASVSTTGNVTGGNIVTGGLITATGNVSGGNLNITGGIVDTGALTIVTGSNGNVAITPNGSGILTVSTAASVTGNIDGGNLRTTGLISATGGVTGSQFNGSGAGLTSIPAGNLSGTTLNSSVVTSSLTTVGALNSGSITSGFGTIDIGTDTVTCGGIVNANANGVGNIGSATTYFNTVFAKATSAQYADLAEMYVSDADYPPGTVVEFGGEQEITITTQSHSTKVAGIISTNPSYLMNSNQLGQHVLPVALTGRVPCQVLGPVCKGDVLVASATPGVAQRIGINWQPGCVIGKAMQDIKDSTVQTIEVAVGRL